MQFRRVALLIDSSFKDRTEQNLHLLCLLLVGFINERVTLQGGEAKAEDLGNRLVLSR